MKKNLIILKTVCLFLFSVILFQGCRTEIETMEKTTQSKNKISEKINFSRFKTETNIKNLHSFIDLHSEIAKVSKKESKQDINSLFRMDTVNINKLNLDNKKTYTFRAYNVFESPDNIYNIIYYQHNKIWEFTIIKIVRDNNNKTEKIVPVYDSSVGELRTISGSGNKALKTSGSCSTQMYYTEFHCTCPEEWGYCDLCSECVSEAVTTVTFDCGAGSSENPIFNTYPSGLPIIYPGATHNPNNPPAYVPIPQNPSPYYFDPNIPPSIDSEYVKAVRSDIFWNQLHIDSQNWAQYNSAIYIELLDHYLSKYSTTNNTNNLNFHNWAIQFLNQNPDTSIEQIKNWFIDGALDYTNPNDVSFAGNLANLSNDLRLANQNGTLNQLQASWPNWQKIKQDIKNAIARGIHDGAKTVKTYYDEIRNNPYIYNSGTRILLNTYIDGLREEVRQTTNMNKDTMKWEDLVKIWLFELMPSKYQNTINFTWASNVINGNNLYNSTTNAVYTFPKGEPSILPNIKNGLKNGSIIVGQSIKGTFTYNFNQYYATLSNNNVGIQMLGSYDIKATIISKSGNVATVRFFITNPLNWDSATRFVQNGTKTTGVVQNKEIGDELHLGGNLTNTYTWDEIITF